MSRHYRNHSRELVDAFVQDLQPEVANSIDTEALDSLAIRIESALSSAVMDELEPVATALEDMSQRLRRHAEIYDD